MTLKVKLAHYPICSPMSTLPLSNSRRGRNTPGYVLKTLTFSIRTLGVDVSLKASIYTSVNDVPGTELYSFDSPSSGTGEKTVSAQNNATLTANTSYFVVFEDTDRAGGRGSVHGSEGSTSFNSYDTDSLTDWSLAGRIHSIDLGRTWGSFHTSQKLAIKLVGEVVTATGQPDIDGTPQVGQTLTAGEGDMADANGLPMTTFPTGYDFQWVRVDGGTETDIGTKGDSQSYTPVAADVGKTLKVKVSFTDGGGTKETLTSEPTAAVLAAAGPCPTDADWCTTLTVGVYTAGGTSQYGYRTAVGDLDNPTIDHGGESWTVSGMLHSEGTDPTMAVQLLSALPANTVFNLGGTEFALADATEMMLQRGVGYGWDLPSGFAWLDGQKVTVSANLPPTLISATIHGTSLRLTYHEELDTRSVPAESAYEVTVAGAQTAVSDVSVSAKTVTLTLDTAVTSGQTVTVSYTVPARRPVRDRSGLEAAALAAIVAQADTTGPQVDSATVSGSQLRITFDEPLGAAANLSNSAFTVKKTPSGGIESTVTLKNAPKIGNATVSLTLDDRVVNTDHGIKVSYTKPTTDDDNRIEDTAGNEAASFTDQPVTNRTGSRGIGASCDWWSTTSTDSPRTRSTGA